MTRRTFSRLSWPGLTRPSKRQNSNFANVEHDQAANLDGRVKPGHDAREMAVVTGESAP